MNLLTTPNKLSRRNWLRDAAIAATGAVVVPSLLISCNDHKVPPGLGGPPTEPLTDFELYSAAQNLLNMEAWLTDFYLYSIGYELEAYALLQTGQKAPANWENFVVELFINIGVGLLEAAAAEIPFVGPVVAITIGTAKSWLEEANRPSELVVNGAFADFVGGHNRMQKALSDSLLILADRTDNYRNLREKWSGQIDFNGKKYTLKDLAGAQFPVKGVGTEFVELRDAAYTKFKKDFWNVMFVKAGEMRQIGSTYESFTTVVPRVYAMGIHYPNHKATYLRGYWSRSAIIHSNQYLNYGYWTFAFDGLELSDAAAATLFIDDAPGNTINPTGLFPRDYVFKQFHRERPSFGHYFEIRRDEHIGSCTAELDPCQWFDSGSDNYDFTGGTFPELIKK